MKAMMKGDREYLSLLRKENLIVEWLLERFDPEMDASGVKVNLKSENTLKHHQFLLKLIQVYDQPHSFDPKAFEDFPLQSILVYLRKTHEFYLQRKLAEIEVTLTRWSDSESHVLSYCFKKFFTTYKVKLQQHIDQEEEAVFPYIDMLLDLNQGVAIEKETLLQSKISLINFILEHDHEIESDLSKFAATLLGYEEIFQGNMAYRTLMRQMKALEQDLTIHANIEEQVLIPRAIELERLVLNDICWQ